MHPLLILLYFFVGVKCGSSELSSTVIFLVGNHLALVVINGVLSTLL